MSRVREFVESRIDSHIFATRWYLNELLEEVKTKKNLDKTAMRIQIAEYDINKDIEYYTSVLRELDLYERIPRIGEAGS